MTTPAGHLVNVAGDNSHVGVQSQYTDIDTVIIPGNVQLTVGQDASPSAKYNAGVENLRSGNPRRARELIWDAMMSGHRGNDVLFHWLVAMLSGRTVRGFTKEESEQLRLSRSRYAWVGGDAWADGVRLIYRLLDSAVPSLSGQTEAKAAKADASFLVKQLKNLGEEQRGMVLPHVEPFLTGHLRDELWEGELQDAQYRQHSGGRLGRAWMFFQPVPKQVLLPSPLPPAERAADRIGMRASACLFAAAAGYLGWELLWNDAVFGLLGYVAVLTGGIVAAAADLEWRLLTGRRRQKDERLRVGRQSAPSGLGDELSAQVNKLFNRYFARYALDKAERERWEAATAGFRTFHADEIIAVCRSSGIRPSEAAWLIRYEVRQLRQRWQKGTLYEYRRHLSPRPATAAARLAGLSALAVGGPWAVIALRAHPLAVVVTLLSGFWAWRCWLHANLERRRHAADREEHARRQQAIEAEFTRWSKTLEARPTEAEMATWLERDRTVLLGRTLDHFGLPRSRLIAHAFLEQPGVAVKRARIDGGSWRYTGYRLVVFLLAEDGVHQVTANLNFTTGTVTERERTSYRYDAIVSVRVLRQSRSGQTFELRLASGDPITIRVRDAESDEPRQDHNAEPAEDAHKAAEAEADTALDVTSAIDLLHMLERVAGQGHDWFQERHWAGAWSGDDAAGHEEADVMNEMRMTTQR